MIGVRDPAIVRLPFLVLGCGVRVPLDSLALQLPLAAAQPGAQEQAIEEATHRNSMRRNRPIPAQRLRFRRATDSLNAEATRA
jgi:hypothetical protein